MSTTARRDPTLPDLGGRVALVTGASGGIGAGIARRLAAAGANVIVGFRNDRDGAVQLAADIEYDGIRCIALSIDITDPASCQDAMQQVVAHFGSLDVLINNAGIQPLDDLADMSPGQWQRVIDTNVTGTFVATQSAAALMRGRGGAIIHISSIEGSAPAWRHAHYATAKAAVIMHARAAALEYGGDGIRVNAVSPGLVDRPGLRESWSEGVNRYESSAPLGRIGEPGDIGDACVFLASDMARWITGINLVVDGGVSVHPTW